MGPGKEEVTSKLRLSKLTLCFVVLVAVTLRDLFIHNNVTVISLVMLKMTQTGTKTGHNITHVERSSKDKVHINQVKKI